MKILLLEDDQILNESLTLFLKREGFSVDSAYDINEAEDLTYQNRYDLYLFDIDMPQGSGLELLKALRDSGDNTAVIFITALQDLYSMTKGFELGAIDYIKKPFVPEELLIRLRAKFKKDTLYYQDIEYDEPSGTLRKDGEIIDIGNVQFCIFVKLLKNCGKMVLKEELYECLDKPSSNSLRVAITKIKQRLAVDIINIRAKGYILEKR